MKILSVLKWAEHQAKGPTAVTLDDDSSAQFELCAVLNFEVSPTERWLTCIVRDEIQYAVPERLPKETESDLISGGGGLTVSLSRTSGFLSQLSVPVMHGFIDEVRNENFIFREHNRPGVIPVFDTTPWQGANGGPSATRAFRAPVRSIFLKSQDGIMVRWAEGDGKIVSWSSVDESFLVGVDQENKLIGFALVGLKTTILDLMIGINFGY